MLNTEIANDKMYTNIAHNNKMPKNAKLLQQYAFCDKIAIGQNDYGVRIVSKHIA